ncbi:DNA-directed RNA polymerase II subunit rpb1-like [Syngnathus scovelli]|uniref:DNA-directed RNA polymerase II subunit rpb1-like n=1 Tax=Syngnathus scovelli TaxID=161590 RepID=UPI00210FCAB9|nr:DNA-directed RNA polymerase II subunit rpb1-like [Syngnathus scovelli]
MSEYADLYAKEAEQDRLARNRFNSLTQSQYKCTVCGTDRTYLITKQTSSDDVLATSVAEINRASFKQEPGALYDPKLGPFLTPSDNEPTYDKQCVTCRSSVCPGHFGHIELAQSVILHYKECVAFLRVLCHSCGRHIPGTKFESALWRLPPQHSLCAHCGRHQPVVRCASSNSDPMYIVIKDKGGTEVVCSDVEYARGVFERVTPETLAAMGPGYVHPMNLIMKRFLVLPSCCRPPNKVGGALVHDDLTLLISYIVKRNLKLASAVTEEVRRACYVALKGDVLSYMDNSKGRAVHVTSNKSLVGLKECISKKGGLLRQNIMGKRHNYTARSVVGPESTLLLDQVAVPPQVADTLTVEETVTKYNLDKIRHMRAMGHLKGLYDECGRRKHVVRCGLRVERSLMDGDVVVLNRQPTLHRNSMLGMRVKVLPGKTIRVNLAVTHGFNMDFDGDEGNLYLPRSVEARAEVMALMSPYTNILSDCSTGVEVMLVQDTVLALYTMSVKADQPLETDFAAQCCMAVDTYDPVPRTARDLFRLMMPPDFEWSRDGVVFSKGGLVHGHVTKRALSGGHDSIIRSMALEHGQRVAGRFIDRAQFVAKEWLVRFPVSVGLDDMVLPDTEHITRVVYDQHMAMVGTARDEVETVAILESIKNTLMAVPMRQTAMSTMTRAGSKGDTFNTMQMSMMLGQQYVEGMRVQRDLDCGYRTLPFYRAVELENAAARCESRGFVRSAFLDGLNPREAFFHAKCGREGMISTSQMTGVTGYAERRMVKFSEDLRIANDLSVRDANGNIVQLLYGGHGLDPMLCWRDGNPVDFERLARRIDASADVRAADPSAMAAAAKRVCDRLALMMPEVVRASVMLRHGRNITEGSSRYPCGDPHRWEREVYAFYAKAVCVPGSPVGIVCAQAFGARQTQSTLNIFHRAGGLHDTGSMRFGEILNLSKKNNKRILYVHTVGTPSLSGSKDALGSAFFNGPVEQFLMSRTTAGEYVFDRAALFDKRVTMDEVIAGISGKHGSCCSIARCAPYTLRIDRCTDGEGYLAGVSVGSAPTASSVEYVFDKGAWVAVVTGSTLLYALGVPGVDVVKTRCNNVWDVYEAKGLVAVKRFLTESMVECLGSDVHMAHVRLLVDRMTFSGTPTAVDRYTMRRCETGPISKATFEESMDILVGSAMRGQQDHNAGVGACLVAEWLPYHHYAGKRIAVDAAYVLHRFKTAHGGLWDTLLKRFVASCATANNIELTFVFDGKSPVEKKHEQSVRASRRLATLLKHQAVAEAVSNGNKEVIERCKATVAQKYNVTANMISTRMVDDYVRHRVTCHQAVSPEHYIRMRGILSALGVPYVHARTEGEMHCVKMVADGAADLVMTIDTDAILVAALHGVPYVLTNFKAGQFCQVGVADVLAKYRMSPPQFLDFCILLGTDFNKHIRGIGPVKARRLIEAYGRIEDMHTVDTLQLGNYQRVREIFMSCG